jgi:hypothetical protein
LRRVDAQAEALQSLVCGSQALLCGGGVSLEELDQPGKDVSLEESLRDAQLFDHPP